MEYLLWSRISPYYFLAILLDFLGGWFSKLKVPENSAGTEVMIKGYENHILLDKCTESLFINF